MNVARVLFGMLAFAGVFGAFFIAGSPAWYWDAPSLVIVPGFALLLAMAAHGPGRLFGAWRTAVRGGDAAALETALQVLRGFRRLVAISGVFGVMTGLVAIFANTGDFTIMGKGMAVAILCPLYSIIVDLFACEPFIQKIKVWQAV